MTPPKSHSYKEMEPRFEPRKTSLSQKKLHYPLNSITKTPQKAQKCNSDLDSVIPNLSLNIHVILRTFFYIV